MPEWGQHCSNHGMPCLVSIFGTFRATWDQPNEDPAAPFRYPPDIISNITNREIHQPGILIARKIGQVSLVGCTNDWHTCCPGRKLILRIPPPIAGAHLAVCSATFRVCKALLFKIEVHQKWEI